MNHHKNLNKLSHVLVTLLILSSLIPWPGQLPVQAAGSNTITVAAVNTGKLTIPVKGKYKLEAKAGSGKLTYKSSRPKVAKVNKKGLVKGLKPGKAVITIKAKGASKKISVKVVKKSKYKKVKKISLKDTPSDIPFGGTTSLKVAFNPAKASNKNLKFKSSDTGVATVNEKGLVRAMSSGSTTITVTSCANKKARVTADITVTTIDTYTVSFDSAGGTETEPQTVHGGGRAVKPEDPVLNGAEFAGWYLEGAEDPFSFSTPIHEDTGLFARWNVTTKVSADGVVDAGDLSLLEAAGKIQVMSDEDSSTPHAIIGSFTEEKVNDRQDAVEVLESIASLFNKVSNEDGTVTETEFDVRTSEITAETVRTPADEDGQVAPTEVLYRYCPTTTGGTPVVGADIILVTDEAGNVTGLNSTYDPAFRTLPEVRGNMNLQQTAEAVAKRYLMTLMRDNGTYVFPQTKLPQLYTQSRLEVFTDTATLDQYAAARAEEGTEINSKPFYTYKVQVTTYDPDIPAFDPAALESAGPKEPGSGEDYDSTTPRHVKESEIEEPQVFADWTVYVDPTNYLVPLAFDNSNNADWTDGSFSLRCNDGKNHSINMRYKDSDDSRCYQFYDSSRKIYVYRVQDYLGKDDTGKDIYGTPDYSQTNGLWFWDKKTGITRHFGEAGILMYNIEKVYDYYKNNLGRDSFDDNGTVIPVGYNDLFIEDSTNANSSWWSKSKKITFTIGDGKRCYTPCLDVMGHEFTHGVFRSIVPITESKGENGALNEAFADIMGGIIEGKFVKDNSKAENWDQGEDAALAAGITAGRNLADPSRSNKTQKYHYSDKYISTPVKNSDGSISYEVKDNGGVHWNSTIFSHAFYLMTTDKRIRGEVSYSKWAQLFYRSLNRLTPNSQLIDGRYAILSEARTMRFSAAQLQAISDAFDEVGLEDPTKISFILTWGKEPDDLDLHLVGPADSSYYHVYHGKKTYSTYQSWFWGLITKRTLVASLDQDSREPYGTEVIKIHKRRDGTYYCFVNYHYGYSDPDSTVLANSHAQVILQYSGDKSVAYNVQKNSKGTCWVVCKMVIKNGRITSCVGLQEKEHVGSGEVYRHGTDDLINTIYKQY